MLHPGCARSTSERRENNMTKKILLACLVFVLAGCAGSPPRMMGGGGTSTDPCPNPVCKVKVTVSGNCQFAFDPSTQHMYIDAANRNMLIEWDLAGAKFIDDQSIYLKDPGANDPPDLTQFHKVSDAKFTVHNAHSVVGKSYAYGLRVEQYGSVCDHHPWIDN
jgi:hypothetical protein